MKQVTLTFNTDFLWTYGAGFQGSLVSKVTRLWAGWQGFNFWQRQGFFIITESRPVLSLIGPAQPPIQ